MSDGAHVVGTGPPAAPRPAGPSAAPRPAWPIAATPAPIRRLPPYPDGWFRVAASADVPHGAVRPLRYFGRELVAFRGDAPTWEIPEMPEMATGEWTAWRPARQWRIRCQIQDIAENGIDTAHMPLVHGSQTKAIRSESLRTDGPVLVHAMAHEYRLFPLARRLGARVSGPLEITYHGLGCAVNRARVDVGPTLEFLFLFTFTPIDETAVEVSSILSVKKLWNPLVTWLLRRHANKQGGDTIDQDVPIFEHKIHRAEPLLTERDGPIMQYRRWARQFYSEVGA